MEYIGEHLLPGKFGHFFAVFGFVMSLLAVAAYYFATQQRDTEQYAGWQRIGRAAFGLHGLSVFAVIGLIFYIMLQQYYEYQYVWAHVSDDLPFKYIFSAFWEGQEGSFLLWMFWHVVLGIILIFKAGRWEAPVVAVLALVQAFIGSMILGLYPGFLETDWKLGSSPFVLLRDVMNAPIFAQADYLSLVKGNGLNPLLQNYWMTIHPPTLFLGFASTVVPFCYAIAGLWTGEHKAWLKPVLPWALFSGFILGLGILMGGAWAYEALSFGGYWAWDPVENMSLVPWLILLAGIHTNVIANSTGYSIKTSYLFYLLSFILIVYSTFLTRSGVLGDTSVHAFTEMGLEAQLIAFIFAFLLLSLFLFFKNERSIPSPKKEESISSKEFWMFIGTLVLLFSGLLISLSTSLPVYNKIYQLFDPLYEGVVINDQVTHHNKRQLWIGIFIGLLSGCSQFLRFREFDWAKRSSLWGRHVGVAAVIALLGTWLCVQWIEARAWQYKLLLFFSLFTVICNLDYLLFFVKTNLKASGAAFSHMGFGLMIVGVLASGLNKKVISSDPFGQAGLLSPEQVTRNIVLLKDEPVRMQDYEVTYVSDTFQNLTRTFLVNYKKRGPNNEITEEFNLSPNVLYDKNFTNIAASNPSTKRYLNRDIFTHISSLPEAEMNIEVAKAQEDSLEYQYHQLAIGDTLHAKKYIVELLDVNQSPRHPEYQAAPGDRAVGLLLKFRSKTTDESWEVEPIIILRETLLFGFAEEIQELNLKVKLTDAAIRMAYGMDRKGDFRAYTFKKGDRVSINGHQIFFDGFNTKVNHPDHQHQEGDIAVGARMLVQPVGKKEKLLKAEPVYLIRGNRPFNYRDELSEPPLVFQFTGIDPAKETIEMNIALMEETTEEVFSFEIADDVPRTDFIVLEAILFPGINLFWLGSLMMLGGIGVSMFHRRKQV